MHIFFSGVGGAAIGPLALIAKQAGYEVSGSDARDSASIEHLRSLSISDIHIGQTAEAIAAVHTAKPIDWYVYSSALPKDDPNHPELAFARAHKIKATKRDELLNQIITDHKLKLIAIAGTHGKTTTTAMAVWLFQQLGIKISYSVGAKLSFGEMGHFEPGSQFFIYEADEYDRNFLQFRPQLSLITGLDWDHADVYPTRQDYEQAFRQFLGQSQLAVLWQSDFKKLALKPGVHQLLLTDNDPAIDKKLKLTGHVNRLNAWLSAHGLEALLGQPVDKLLELLNNFPSLGRRFEPIADNLYSDYAHTPPKIRGALATAEEVAPGKVVVIYEGLHNTRQHFIKDELKNLFDEVKHLYLIPSYLAREDRSLPLLSPSELVELLSPMARHKAQPARLDDKLAETIEHHRQRGDLVLALSAGGGGSLDEWLRSHFPAPKT